ncbi:hypothetical protein KY345_04650 [Candidatus Woesearchaeota archaeon]|nr:hypothetical protein [Candidatus Woesearchaeota archaeon]
MTISTESKGMVYSFDMGYVSVSCTCPNHNGGTLRNSHRSSEDITNTVRQDFRSKVNGSVNGSILFDDYNHLEMELKNNHNEEKGQDPLVLVCNGCKREYPLTYQRYRTIWHEIFHQ